MRDDRELPADLVSRAREFAVNAHTRIGHMRKYQKLSYATHLHKVAGFVASVINCNGGRKR